MNLVIATANPGKAREFREMLGQDRFEWSDLSQHGDAQSVEETGHTFRANACLKASHYAKALNSWALADDSGLAVDALTGNPGVYSARWAILNNTGRSDADNNTTLLQQLTGVSDDQRTARFVCVLALSDEQGRIIFTTQAHVEGTILRAPRGAGGFGYDPLFFVPSHNKAMAELTPDEKHAISHRGQALRRMREKMDEWVRG